MKANMCFCVLLIFFMIAQPPLSVQATERKSTVKASNTATETANAVKGDYIQFGSYNEQPLLWQVIHVLENGNLLLWSDKIISVKVFDAFGDLVDGRGNEERIRVGANYWAGSSLREWLNSGAECVTFTYNPPSKENLWNGLNAYANEPGFLSNFTESQLVLIQETENKSLLAQCDCELKEGGTEAFTLQGSKDLSKSVQNYDNAYYHTVTDKVFILDIKQLAEYVSANGFSQTKAPTEEAVARSEYKSPSLTASKDFNYWTRTPITTTADKCMRISSAGVSGDTSVDNRNLGLVPAVIIASDFTASSGDGSAESPYVIQ